MRIEIFMSLSPFVNHVSIIPFDLYVIEMIVVKNPKFPSPRLQIPSDILF